MCKIKTNPSQYSFRNIKMHLAYTAVIVRLLAGSERLYWASQGHKIPALKSQLFKIDRDFVTKCKAQPTKSK